MLVGPVQGFHCLCRSMKGYRQPLLTATNQSEKLKQQS